MILPSFAAMDASSLDFQKIVQRKNPPLNHCPVNVVHLSSTKPVFGRGTEFGLLDDVLVEHHSFEGRETSWSSPCSSIPCFQQVASSRKSISKLPYLEEDSEKHVFLEAEKDGFRPLHEITNLEICSTSYSTRGIEVLLERKTHETQESLHHETGVLSHNLNEAEENIKSVSSSCSILKSSCSIVPTIKEKWQTCLVEDSLDFDSTQMLWSGIRKKKQRSQFPSLQRSQIDRSPVTQLLGMH